MTPSYEYDAVTETLTTDCIILSEGDAFPSAILTGETLSLVSDYEGSPQMVIQSDGIHFKSTYPRLRHMFGACNIWMRPDGWFCIAINGSDLRPRLFYRANTREPGVDDF